MFIIYELWITFHNKTAVDFFRKTSSSHNKFYEKINCIGFLMGETKPHIMQQL